MSRSPKTVTFLEVKARPEFAKPALNVLRASPFPSWYFLALYQAVGGDYHWTDMLQLSPAELQNFCENPHHTLYTLIEGGAPAGFFILNDATPNFDLVYFGLTPETHGHGLGAQLLEYAIQTAWENGAQSLKVNTCTLDHPRALPLYQSRGFMVVSEEHHEAIP